MSASPSPSSAVPVERRHHCCVDCKLGPSMQRKPVSNDFQPPPVQPVGLCEVHVAPPIWPYALSSWQPLMPTCRPVTIKWKSRSCRLRAVRSRTAATRLRLSPAVRHLQDWVAAHPRHRPSRWLRLALLLDISLLLLSTANLVFPRPRPFCKLLCGDHRNRVDGHTAVGNVAAATHGLSRVDTSERTCWMVSRCSCSVLEDASCCHPDFYFSSSRGRRKPAASALQLGSYKNRARLPHQQLPSRLCPFGCAMTCAAT